MQQQQQQWDERKNETSDISSIYVQVQQQHRENETCLKFSLVEQNFALKKKKKKKKKEQVDWF